MYDSMKGPQIGVQEVIDKWGGPFSAPHKMIELLHAADRDFGRRKRAGHPGIRRKTALNCSSSSVTWTRFLERARRE